MSSYRFAIATAIALLLFSSATADWKAVAGDLSIISRMGSDISRSNVYAVLRYNTEDGEVHHLQSTYGSNAISDKWVRVREGSQGTGNWELVVGECSLLTGVSRGDIDKENVYVAMLIDGTTGRAYRLLVKGGGGPLSATWQEIARPIQAPKGVWRPMLVEHSVAQLESRDLSRQNVYSLFICDSVGGTVLRLESWYMGSGSVKDRWVGGQ
jgi:hypothetical protein